MKAFLFYGPKDIRLEELDDPDIGKSEVIIKIKSALSCGTDLKTYLRGHPKLIKTIPSSFGYEFAGIISESNNPNFKIGERVIAANSAPCFECFFCKKAEYELCENLEFLNGSFAEYIKVPAQIAEHNLYKIPETLDFKTAAATQTLAVCLQGFEKSQIKDGDLVCVYGTGAVGLCFIKLCKKLRKQVTVIAVGNSILKQNLAKANGADYLIDYKDPDYISKIKSIKKYGADVVLEATGKVTAWQDCLKIVRPGGLINFFGGCKQGSSIELDTYQVHYLETRIIGSFHHQPKYIKQALDLLSAKTISVDDLITHEFKLEDLEKALLLMEQGECIKAEIKA